MSDINSNEDQADAKLVERVFIVTITVLVAIEAGIILWIAY